MVLKSLAFKTKRLRVLISHIHPGLTVINFLINCKSTCNLKLITRSMHLAAYHPEQQQQSQWWEFGGEGSSLCFIFSSLSKTFLGMIYLIYELSISTRQAYVTLHHCSRTITKAGHELAVAAVARLHTYLQMNQVSNTANIRTVGIHGFIRSAAQTRMADIHERKMWCSALKSGSGLLMFV